MPSATDLERAAAEQAGVCQRVGSPFHPVDYDLKLGLAMDTLRDMPITGVRTAPENGTDGWYIWGGEYSDAPDFFKPVHVHHVLELLPMIAKYLALAPGFKFIVDDEGYEDVWFEGDGGGEEDASQGDAP